MTMLEVHADALESSNAAYHEFLLRYKASQRVVYGFVEGKDDPSFYRSLIEHCLPEGWEVELIRSGNKDNVLNILEEMDWTRFPPRRISFFVDRDLSEFLGGQVRTAQNLYVTDNYSIENEVATFGTLKRVLEEILNITELSSVEDGQIKELFELNLSFFREAMVPLMAQIMLWRRNGSKPCLNDIAPKLFFRFADGRIDLKPDFITVASRMQHAASSVHLPQSAEDDLAKAEAEFRSKQGVEKFVRGKYLLWFFVECALEFHRAIPKLSLKHSTLPKVRLALGQGNAMVVIGTRVRCPASLRRFLEDNYCQFIREL